MRGAEPVLCLPFTGLEDQVAALRADLAAAGPLDVAAQVVRPDEAARAPEVSLRMRLSVLLRTYRGDYHTDAFDFDRLARRLASGDEAVWFFGSPAEVARLRALMAAPAAEEVPPLELGTVTVLDVGEEYGPGHGELCRSGSQDRAVGGKAPFLARTLGYLDGGEEWLRGRYHTLVLVPRNRPSAPGVRGGEAVHRIHSRYLRSRFWGFAPWYVMQGGVLELLDFRESNRDPGEVRAALARSAPWLLSDPAEAAFARRLCRLNFGVEPPVLAPPAGAAPPLPARLLAPAPGPRARCNHATLCVGEGDAGAGTELDRLDGVECCCAVVRLRLDDPGQARLQPELARRGYRLTSVLPPKDSWVLRGGAREALCLAPYGFWSRPAAGLPVVQPFYRGFAGASPDEAGILDYLRDRLSFADAPPCRP